jgi:hypothetical protein
MSRSCRGKRLGMNCSFDVSNSVLASLLVKH